MNPDKQQTDKEKVQRWNYIADLILLNPPRPSLMLEGTECPECGKKSLSFSFAVHKISEGSKYSLYVICENHPGYIHYNLNNRPLGFDEYLINPIYQKIEEEIAEQVKLLHERVITLRNARKNE